MGSIYDRRDVPGICCIYLYYVDPDDLRNNRVYCYWGDSRPIEDVDARIGQLIENAFGAKDDPPPCAQYLIDVAMRRVSYLVIVGKDSEIREQNPLAIVDWETREDEADHTFCNAERRLIPVKFGDATKSVAVVVNRMWSELADQPLEDEYRDSFEFYCYDTRDDDILDGRGHAHDHESGGTNMGPPVPPP